MSVPYRPLREVVAHDRFAGVDMFTLSCGHQRIAKKTSKTPKRSRCLLCDPEATPPTTRSGE